MGISESSGKIFKTNLFTIYINGLGLRGHCQLEMGELISTVRALDTRFCLWTFLDALVILCLYHFVFLMLFFEQQDKTYPDYVREKNNRAKCSQVQRDNERQEHVSPITTQVKNTFQTKWVLPFFKYPLKGGKYYRIITPVRYLLSSHSQLGKLNAETWLHKVWESREACTKYLQG